MDLAQRAGKISWYHTLELAPGVITDGEFDLRPWVDHYGVPARLDGKRALDIGSFDGFWAFELERRGAAEVIALDIDHEADLDWPPRRRPEHFRGVLRGAGFRLAREALGSSVQRVTCNIYEADPAELGTFDLVICGSVLMHLRDQLGAIERVARLCRGTFISAEEYDSAMGMLPFSASRYLADRDSAVVFWLPGARTWQRMLWTGGFDEVHRYRRFKLPSQRGYAVRHVVHHARHSAIAGQSAPARRRDPAVAPGAGSCVRQPGRFLAHELRAESCLAAYRLRRSGLWVHVRHPLLDMWVLEEIFRFRVYEPPPEVAHWLRSLGRPAEIVDLGGHVGLFALFTYGRFPDAHVISFEPSPANAAVLRRSIEANRLDDRWQLIEACATTLDGTAELQASFHLTKVVSDRDPALETLQRGIESVFPFLHATPLVDRQRQRVPARDVFPFLVGADLIKLDIEGSEWDLLADPRFPRLAAPAIVLEYHPAYAPATDPDGPDGDPETVVLDALAGAGYEVRTQTRTADGGLIWALKPGVG
jgi:tRNA (mo5U34)-methyltransferase